MGYASMRYCVRTSFVRYSLLLLSISIYILCISINVDLNIMDLAFDIPQCENSKKQDTMFNLKLKMSDNTLTSVFIYKYS